VKGAAIGLLSLLLGGCREQTSAAAPDDAGNDSAVATGELAISAYGCPQCHQSRDPDAGLLSGQTTPVSGSQAYGSNLTPDPDTGMDAWDAGAIARAILAALDRNGNALCPQMPAYGDAGMSADEAAEIALYLQSLPAVWHPVPPSVCPPIKGGDGGDGG
jgi:hypothetical protein